MKTNITSFSLGLFAGGVVLSLFLGFSATKEWRYNITGRAMLAQAENEKKVAIEEAKALSESARYEAQADIVRAEGIAESNRIINNSLTPLYIRWLFVEGLKDSGNQVIYLPTEAGIPILESSRHIIDNVLEEHDND